MSLFSRLSLWFFGPEKPYVPSVVLNVGTEPLNPKEFTSGDFSRDTWDTAALRIVGLNYRTHTSLFGGTVAQCESVLARIAADRHRYDHMKPAKLQPFIQKWFDHFEQQAKTDLVDCHKQLTKKEQDEWRKLQASKDECVTKLMQEIRKANP